MRPRLHLLATLAALTCAVPGTRVAAQPPQTRLLVTEVSVKPDRIEDWLSLQAEKVVPALRRAGMPERDVFRGVVGETTTFLVVEPLPSFAAFDGGGAVAKVLGERAAMGLEAQLNDCIVARASRIEYRRDDFYLNPGDANVVYFSRYRAMPGRAADYMNFIRDEMMPVMRQAQEDGTFAGLTVTVSGQGGEAGLITLNMFYDSFAPLDDPPPIAKTLGPADTAEFLRKGAGLITGIQRLVYERIPALSF